jgi:hypothetical protein
MRQRYFSFEYLMIPDPDVANIDYDDCHTAAVSKCQVDDAFDTLAACKARLDADLQEEGDMDGAGRYFGKAACIATDDPRLKGK